ncbi:Fic family protein [Kribbella aluminosa]|uniref:Fic family protein n=1 Tax=Kribbella aluminosa TaxID=416017 RepID=A0ABS4V0G0_9ACTN|nr:Fic family protein [Kribbella aluminosa]MBP2357397.1 Fic family protein [Kribbella aluminosa]
MESEQAEWAWPPHMPEVRQWRQRARGGTAADRMLTEVTIMRPPLIARRQPRFDGQLLASMEACVLEIAALDHSHGAELAALETLLLRTESVASSKIEHIDASVDDYARALHGVKSNPSATSMAASTAALAALIGSVGAGAELEVSMILMAHLALMLDDPSESAYAGRFRDLQNWIGGSDYSPRNAVYVPPAPETVVEYMADLVTFANRTDLPVLTQAAIVHAQFESIHPFTDGNGRIGRALINTVLRRRGATRRVVVPLASALVARRAEYFDVLGEYREGRIEPIVRSFTTASVIAAREAQVSASRIAGMQPRWRREVAARRGSAADRLLDRLIGAPIFSASEAEDAIGGATSSVYAGIERLHAAGVIRPLTARTRNQVWGAVELLDELADLAVRIEAAAH